MGIHDRDYARPSGGGFPSSPGMGGRGGGWRSWSVNTWLIVICVAVFMIDAFMPRMMSGVRTVPVVLDRPAVSALPANWDITDFILADAPEDARLDDVDRSKLRWNTLGQILEQGRRVFIEIPTEAGSRYEPVALRKGAPLPLRIFVPTGIPADGGEGKGTFGTVSEQGLDGKPTERPVYLLVEQVVGGPGFVYGYFSTDRALIGFSDDGGIHGFEVWRFITFQFLHANLGHLLFNMLGLFFFGSLVEQYLGSKRYLAFYLICGIMGAFAYLVLNLAGWSVFSLTGREVPGLLVNDPGTPLVGASAGVFGVVVASAFLVPNARVLLFFVIPMRLATLAYGLVIVALLSVFFGSTNAGGEAAHIGGAIAGFWLIRRPNLLHGFFDFLGRYDPTSRSGAARRAGLAKERGLMADSEIDRILAKIHEHGLQSLTAKEKRLLREASRR